jgi:hypothetical protein
MKPVRDRGEQEVRCHEQRAIALQPSSQAIILLTRLGTAMRCGAGQDAEVPRIFWAQRWCTMVQPITVEKNHLERASHHSRGARPQFEEPQP